MNKTPPPLPPRPPGPPRRPGVPGSAGPSGPGGRGPRVSPPVTPTSSGGVKRPPLVHFAVALVLVMVELWLMVQSSKVDVGSHFAGAALGMFVSVVVLGTFRLALNRRRASGAFSEWGGPIESTKFMWILVLTSWGLGTWHLWLAMYEILRPA